MNGITTWTAVACGAIVAVAAAVPATSGAQARAGSSERGGRVTPAPREARAPAGRPLDERAIRDTAVASLVRAERLFMEDAERRRGEGWVAAFAADAATFPARSPVVVGTEGIRARMTPLFADTSVHVVWYPIYAAVSVAGDVGYSYGYARWTSRDSTGAAEAPSDAKYVTIWRRDRSGRWKVEADLGNDAAVPAGFFDARR